MKMSPSSNTRWCPTPEQLMVLEELYRRGLRTPSAAQIQKITAHLSLYGKIQGKNVFYWFQNHKARDRQKLRNKLAKQLHQQHHHLLHHHLYNFPQNHFLDFQISSPFSAHNIHFQGSGVCEEVPDGGVMSRQAWRSSDPPKDCLMRTYGHDSTMVIDVGSTLPCCRSKPLQTLELFPLTSPTTQKTSPTSSLLINN